METNRGHLLTVVVGGQPVAVVMARPDETILRAVNRAGYHYRRGCRRGGCGACVATVVAGRTEYEAAVSEDVLNASAAGPGDVLTCRAVPVTDVTVELRPDADWRCTSPIQRQLANRDVERLRSERQGA